MKIITITLLALLILPLNTTIASEENEYKILETRDVMGVKLSFTNIAFQNAKKEGSTLQASLQKISPFFFISLVMAGKNVKNFKAYIIDKLSPTSQNSVNIAAILVGDEFIDLAYPKKQQINTISKLMNSLGKNKKIRIAKSNNRGVNVSM